MAQHRVERSQVLAYVPNLVCYARLAALVCAAVAPLPPAAVYCTLLAVFAADGLDGWLARRLGQVSQFGAFLDVVADIAARGWLWAVAAPPRAALGVVLLETLCFTCTHASAGSRWKDEGFGAAPRLVAAVMAKGFRTPLGALAVYGLYGLPLWLYAARYLPGTPLAWPVVGAAAAGGRTLAVCVECWAIAAHVGRLLAADAADLAARQASKRL